MGCPFNCSFCASPWLRKGLYGGKGQPRRYRSVSHLLAEVKQAREIHPGIEVVQFWDEVFGIRPPAGWLDEFCDRFPREVGLPFGIWSHPAVAKEETVGKLRSAGLSSVVLGVESGDPQVRKEVFNRRESDAVVLRAARAFQGQGVALALDFIMHLPWLTEENCRGTFNLIMQLSQPFDIALHSLSFLPGAEITRRALAEKKIRPQQVSRADQPLPERFEAIHWKDSLIAGDRSSTYWHSLIYLAAMPFVPRSLVWRLRRLERLLKLCPRPLAVAAEAARTKKVTGRLKLWPALALVYPGLAGFFARHPSLGWFVNRAARALGRLLWRLARLDRARPQ
jgi:radical SAM superfamily enzyme YgiQ (UPF0313 family)